MEKGLDPAEQLCTADFAGRLSHNVNLSVKSIMAIGGYSMMCNMLGYTNECKKHQIIAATMANEWQKMAWDQDHYKLAFDKPGTWSLKYNMIWDEIFELNLFPENVKKTEVDYYLSKQNKYGVPLDNRNAYAKADWIVWVASLAQSNQDFCKFIEPLWDFVNESPCRVPFSDWYGTTDRLQKTFQNRTVLGGIFIKVLKDKWASKRVSSR